MLNKKIVISTVLIYLGLFAAGQCFAAKQDKVYTSVTTGQRMVINHNIQEARRKAEADALGIAVQNAYNTLLPNQVIAANLEFFYDKILPNVKEYIITYKVLGGIESKGYYLVGVESKVDTKLLEKTLTDTRILNMNKEKPVIMFFIAEQTPSDYEPRTWWKPGARDYFSLAEEVIARKMTKEQFMVIGNTAQRPDPVFYNIVFRSELDTKAAIELGRQMKADMILMGTAEAKEAINRMGEEKAFNARIHLDGYDLETGNRVLNSQVQAAVSDFSEDLGIKNAMIKAAGLSAQDLIARVDAYWMENLRKQHSFQVRIEGEKFHPRYLALTRRFQQMQGIENMQPKEMGSNYGIIEVFYKGKAENFANALMLKTFDDFGFEFLEVSEKLVSIRLIEKTESGQVMPDQNKTPEQTGNQAVEENTPQQ